MVIAFPQKPSKHGGPGSFQIRFEKELRQRDWDIVYPEDNIVPNVVLILGGTKKIQWLWSLKKKNIPIYFRLGGINWLYKHKGLSKKERWVHDFRLKLTPFVQSYFGSGIIYQSNFAKEWLIKTKQSTIHRTSTIIYNGVDTSMFIPHNNKTGDKSLLCVEGHLDYTPYAIDLLNYLQKELIEKSDFKSLKLYGGFEDPKNRDKLLPEIDYRGKAKRDEMPKVYKDSVFLSLDINATCPNTVIEAMSSGLPVIGFDTGALKELIGEEAGILTPYGSNPWLLKNPNLKSLKTDANKVLHNYKHFSLNARKKAVDKFDFRDVVNQYITFILNEV